MDFNENLILPQKYSNIKFHENPSSGSRFVPHGQTGAQIDRTKLIVTFRNFANKPKMNLHYVNINFRISLSGKRT